MGREDFEKLHVYGLAEQLGDEVWGIVLKWAPIARSTVGLQMIRSADAVGANIAEGAGRTTYKDNRRFVAMARGSLNETIHWLRRAYARSLLKPAEIGRLKALIAKLVPHLNAYLKSIGKGTVRHPTDGRRKSES